MELFKYQQEAVQFIGEKKRAYLALDMGMGKTLTSLAAAERFGKKNVMLIAEKNEIVNSQNFAREVQDYFYPRMEYVSLRDEEIPPLGDGRYETKFVCGINPDGLKKLDLETVHDSFDFNIVDEATMAKTTTTDRFKVVRKAMQQSEYLALLSGTPMMNGAAELYAPLLLLEHALVGDGTRKAREAFESIFAGGHRRKIRNTGLWYQDYAWWAKGANHVRELRYLISDQFFFKRKADTGIFKNKIRTVEQIPMSMEWLAEYGRAWDAYLEEAAKRDVDMNNVRELQALIENGQCYQVNSRWKAARAVNDIASGKFGDRRIVIFSMFIETDELIQTLLKRKGIRFRTFDEVKEWKAGDEPVLVGRIKAHGKGGNVPEASVCLMVDMDFVPSNNIQAENRIDRPEQTRDMKIVYYMAEGKDIVDEHVRQINQDKMRKIEEFMRPLTAEEIYTIQFQGLPALKERYAKHFATLGL
jgi:hypothetical protein